ncbi:MAG: 3-deoxy-D-manno-octulosonic acid transferase [Chthonomonas sp.]|nr:3-deoxy-D-manno-octulosonic acid transferase [Chthonomonas sp.]
MVFVYGLLQMLLAPIWVPWMLLRARRRGGQMNWQERTGKLAINLDMKRPRLWFHAVSVGEVIAAKPILREIRNLNPDVQIVLSVTTTSGHDTAKTQAEGLYDHLVFFPIDIARFVLIALLKVKPHAVAIMETELWMNFLAVAKNLRAHTMLINGRISNRSYPRSMKLRFFYNSLLENMDECLMQTATDAERIQALGARSAEVLGNSKFDEALPSGRTRDEWRQELGIPGDALVIVVGSSRGEDEERIILDGLSRWRDEAWIIFAPRHLERADEVAGLCGSVARRSRGERGQFLLLDTYGELASIYAAADVAIIGGSFAPYGGQNLIQALGQGAPVLHGPHMDNFQSAAREAIDAGASRRVEASGAALGQALDEILGDAALRKKMGDAGRELVARSAGASLRYATRICDAIASNSQKA